MPRQDNRKWRRIVLLAIAWTTLLSGAGAELTQVCPPADLDGDCYVGLTDLAVLAHQWLQEGIVCSSGYLDCDNIYDNGCEVNATTDMNNCGHCGQVCSLPHANTVCQAGVCALDSCDPDWANCDGAAGNGCEVPLAHTTSCSQAQSLGTISGNESDGTFVCIDLCTPGPSPSARGSHWYWIVLRDDEQLCSGMRFRAQLLVPPTSDYDLILYQTCSGGPVASSTNPIGASEEITYAWPDGNRTLWIEVRYVSASNPAAQCATWQLKTYGGCPDGLP